jgi:hypothetical protein
LVVLEAVVALAPVTVKLTLAAWTGTSVEPTVMVTFAVTVTEPPTMPTWLAGVTETLVSPFAAEAGPKGNANIARSAKTAPRLSQRLNALRRRAVVRWFAFRVICSSHFSLCRTDQRRLVRLSIVQACSDAE